MKINEMIAQRACTIVDVRTSLEFIGGHVTGSVNIPVSEIPEKLDQLRRLTQPLVLCCASGGRSAYASEFLKQQGFDCVNGGSWLDVNYLTNQK
jgi:phage shock protein E